MPRKLQKASQSRVWTITDRAAPNHPPVYQDLARATPVSQGLGAITPIRTPSRTQYGQFDTIDKIKGQADLPGMGLEFRMTRAISEILKIVRKGCPIDVQVHIGACKDPTDFDLGWEKIHVLEDADPQNYSTGDLGAFDADQEAVVLETLDLMGTNYYELKPLAFSQRAESEIVQSVLGVTICDAKTCGVCGLPSDGCQRIFAIQASAGASPGVAAEVVFTEDGGATWSESIATSLPVNQPADALLCVGPYLVIISNAGGGIEYASIADLFAGTATWTSQLSGFNASGKPRAGFSFGRTDSWFVGDGGYIYHASDPTSEVIPQTSGDVTTEDLYAISAADEDTLLVGGDQNALLYTNNGGTTWSALTGPSGQALVNIRTVHMLSAMEFLVGYADGKLYYSADGGSSWTQKGLPGGLTEIGSIKFSTRTVGYLIGRVGTGAGAARLLRTINGGYSWYVLPEETGLSVPTAAQFFGLAACTEDPNSVWLGGIETAGGDGILIQGA